MKISYNEACTLHNSTLEQDLALCEKAGFDYMEFRVDKLKEYLATHKLSELKDFFDNSRLKPYALNGIYLYADFLGEKDAPEKARALLDDIDFGCEACRAVGAEYMVMVPPLFDESANRKYDDPWDKIVRDNVRIFGAMADLTAKHRINIGIEIVGAPRCSIRTIEQCNEIIDRVGKPNLGYTLDAFNLYLFEKDDSFASIKKAHPEKIFIVHINGGEEGPLEALRQSYRTFADRGVMNVENYLENLKKIGYDGPVSIEFFREDCWNRPAESVIFEAFETTKKMMQKCNLLN
jgi:2-keto-myo-inositol isomerase